MATQPAISPVARRRSSASTSTSRQPRPRRMTSPARLPEISSSPRSVRLAGGQITLSPSVPTSFDAPLGKHHIAIGKWTQAHFNNPEAITRLQARNRIESTFTQTVMGILAPVEMVDLSVLVLLHAEPRKPPALVVANKSMGQIDLGWIESADQAPILWRQVAYQALVQAIQPVVPCISYDDLFEYLTMLYWDGEYTDAAARQSLIDNQGHEEADLEDMTLPSHVEAKVPEWMKHPASKSSRSLHPQLNRLLKDLQKASKALKTAQESCDPFHFDHEELCCYAPWYEDSLCLPPTTVVPFDIFTTEIDDVARGGMENGFLDATGICFLGNPDSIAAWLDTLRAAVAVITAIQRLTAWTPPADISEA